MADKSSTPNTLANMKEVEANHEKGSNQVHLMRA
jgi:hypothetical protein